MNSDIYKKKFDKLLEIEKKAVSYYKYYLEKVSDKFLLGKLNEIYQDEVEHARLAQSFIDCFKKG
ncbi:hypothetical protein ACFL1K_05420 [Candidatus Omnitrophota bacterium]